VRNARAPLVRFPPEVLVAGLAGTCCPRRVFLGSLCECPSLSSRLADVHAQICRDLDPDTLLAISQVSRRVHRNVASKSAQKLWPLVRQNSGWPDLSEPLPYASLMQGFACQVGAFSASTTATVAHPKLNHLLGYRSAMRHPARRGSTTSSVCAPARSASRPSASAASPSRSPQSGLPNPRKFRQRQDRRNHLLQGQRPSPAHV